jgi:phosphotransferase system HPr (HPr) family protein
VDSRTLRIIDPSGLHARPAARFVQVASRFEARITIRLGERLADAKSLIALLGLTVRPESLVSLEADGPDEIAALNALVAELAPFAELTDAQQPAPVAGPAPVAEPAAVAPPVQPAPLEP